MTPLRQRMIDDMKLRGFSPRTQYSYVKNVAGLAKFYNQPPDKLSKENVQAYLLYMMEDRKLAWSTCNVAISAFRHFYGEILHDESMKLAIPPRKKIHKLPEILSGEEIEHLLNNASNLKSQAMLMTTYGGGLRVSELVGLKVSDIHGQRMMIRIDQGKGNKDRYTILSKKLLEHLRAYLS